MGFKAKARKHKKDAGEDQKKSASKKKEGELPCGVRDCENFADKSMGHASSGRSGLGLNRSSPRDGVIWAFISTPVPTAMPTAARSAVWA